MSDDLPGLEPIDLSLRTPPPAAAPNGDAWAPGWYADPWTAGQYRYWAGQTWTGETSRWGPTLANPDAGGATDPWPSMGSSAGSGYGWPSPAAAAPEADSSPRRGAMIAGVVALVIVLLIAGVVGYAINSSSQDSSSDTVTPFPSSPGTTTPANPTPTTPPGQAVPSDPDSSALSELVVKESDVSAARTVVLIPDGNQLSEPTLDLCNGSYPSEALRTARLQVADVDTGGLASLSTEAVLYRDPDASAQAFAELRRVTRACPHAPVVSPVGGDTVETEFKAAPDQKWADTPTVERQAYSIATTNAGQKSTSIAVYLRRGRALMGVYFPQPDGAQPAVDGNRSIEHIVGVFESRMAALPLSVVRN